MKLTSKWIVLLFLITSMTLFSDQPILKVSRKKVGMDESFAITFSTSENIQGSPDFTPLNDEFEILSKRQSHQTTIINGKTDNTISWTIDLLPRKEGKLTIPSIQIGQSKTLPQEIEVTAPEKRNILGPFFLESEIEPKESVYEQEQILYTLRLFTSVNFSQAQLSDIKVDDPDAIIEKLGEDSQYETYKEGKKYVVLERKYAVFPQKAGEFIFSPAVFEGHAITGGGYSFFNRPTQFKRVYSNEEKIEVKAIPAPFQKSTWFPVQNVTLTSEWSSDPSEIKMGDPLTWTLKIVAEGTMGNLIPDPRLSVPSEIKQYPDKPLIENQVNEKGFIGTKQIKIVLLPSKAGELTIPEIDLKWWDLKSDQLKEAKLPSTVIKVKDDSIAMTTPPPVKEEISHPLQEALPSLPTSPSSPWVWILVGTNALLLLTILFILFNKRKPSPFKRARQELKRACFTNNPKQAETALLSWARLAYPKEKYWNILKIKELASFHEELDELYSVLYQEKKEWNGKPLWQAFTKQKEAVKTPSSTKKTLLKELYRSN